MAEDMVKGLRAAVGFLTTLPVQIYEDDYDHFIARLYLFIPVGILIGMILGVTGLLLQWLFPAPFAAILLLTGIYLLTGTGHLDGLSDMGDGIIAHGTKEKKIAAMKDVHTGTGGVLFVALDLLFLFVLLAQFAGLSLPILLPLLIAEICAKLAMITVIAFGRSLGPGMGAMAIAGARKEHYILGAITAWAAIVFALAWITFAYSGFFDGRLWLACFAAALSPLVVAAASIYVADQHFGGVNGDVIGATNEIARIAALAVMGAVLWMRF